MTVPSSSRLGAFSKNDEQFGQLLVRLQIKMTASFLFANVTPLASQPRAPRTRRRAASCVRARFSGGTMSAVLAARERERLRQMELEAQRSKEQVAMLEVSLATARAELEKSAVSARWKVNAANERARLAETRAAALEEAMATTVPQRPRYALADTEEPPSPHGALASKGTSLSSPLNSPRGSKRRGDSAADLVAKLENETEEERDSSGTSTAPRHGAAAEFAELVTWRRRGKTARFFFGGLYVQLCVKSFRTMPLPFWTVGCYGFIFALAGSLVWRVVRGLRVVMGQGKGVGVTSELNAELSSTDSVELEKRQRREHDARRFAAKFGGWVAASAAQRAPLLAELVIQMERTFCWEEPRKTLKVCAVSWLVSIVARVWPFQSEQTLLIAWIGTFLLPPVLVLFGPAMNNVVQGSVDDLSIRFSYLLHDKKVQLCVLCVLWSATGVAGRTLLGLAVATAFLTGGNVRGNGSGDAHGHDTQHVNAGVVITELPSGSPESMSHKSSPTSPLSSPERLRKRLPAIETRPSNSRINSSRPSRAAQALGSFHVVKKTTVVTTSTEQLVRNERLNALQKTQVPAHQKPSSPTSSEDSPSPPRRPVASAASKRSTDRYMSGTISSTGVSAARARMIAERTRRILDDEYN